MDKIHKELGVCQESQKVKNGVLAEGSPSNMKKALVQVLRKEGFFYEEALLIINQLWKECESILHETPESPDKNVKSLFKKLKEKGIKLAVCTGDARETTVSDLTNLGLLKYVDMMVCGDDPHSVAKPSGHNTTLICEELNIDPNETIVVGDSVQDLHMGEQAHVKSKIGVLTGVGTENELREYADCVVPSVGHVLNHIMEESDDESSVMNGSKSNIPEQIDLPRQKAFTRTYSTMSKTISPNQHRKFSTSANHCAQQNSEIKTYDYVIVGAGSAGCVLANRLTSQDDNKVLLLEAGPKDNTWKIHMPAALMYNLCDDKYNWYYHTEPEKAMDNRVMYWPRGRVWGGSSSLNAMVYIRGHALDYDRWEKEGAAGWSYSDCLPYFRKSQTHDCGADDYRGGDGPLHVTRAKSKNPLFQAFLDAGVQAGYPYTDDMNGYQQEGVGWMDMTIHNGRRWSTSSAYLRPVLSRDNLNTETRAITTRILFDKKQAIGVEYEQGGEKKRVHAEKEVILSGGAINSPQLLMLSGIGNADDLKAHGIDSIVHLPGVGENLQDHLEVYVQQKCTQPITLYTAQWKFPHNMIRIGLEWFLSSTGDAASTHLETGGFIRSRAGVDHPDLQFHFLPSVVNDHGRKSGNCHAYQVHVGPMRPTSRGYLKLKSCNPNDHPIIVANYLSTETDVREMRDAIRLSREIFAQKAFDSFRGTEIAPGSDIQSDEQIDAFIRQKSDSAYHPSCTCKMGDSNDAMAVVDPQTRVIGVEGLRVVDASIMPSVVSGNLNGPTIMLAEKAADIILGNNPLTKSNASVWKPKTLETQR